MWYTAARIVGERQHWAMCNLVLLFRSPNLNNRTLAASQRPKWGQHHDAAVVLALVPVTGALRLLVY